MPPTLPSQVQKKLFDAKLGLVEAELERVKLAAANAKRAAAKAERAAASKLKQAEAKLKRAVAKLELHSEPAPAPDAVPDEQHEQACQSAIIRWRLPRAIVRGAARSHCASQ